ncbi:MAG: hypothetical protein AAFX53_00150 [Bacteroidota bacterium]
MNKTNYLSLSGLSMFLAGVIMLLSETIGGHIAKIAVPLSFFVGGIFALLFSQANKHHNIAKNFHLLQGLGMIAFAVVIGTMAHSLEGFLKFVTFFLMVYGLFELMFSFSVLRTKYKIDKSILATRLVVGLINFIGAFVVFMTLLKNPYKGLLVAGILVVLGGLGFLFFANRIKNLS